MPEDGYQKGAETCRIDWCGREYNTITLRMVVYLTLLLPTLFVKAISRKLEIIIILIFQDIQIYLLSTEHVWEYKKCNEYHKKEMEWISPKRIQNTTYIKSVKTDYTGIILMLTHSYACNRSWRPIGLWDVEDPTLSRQSAHRWWWGWQPYAPVTLYSQQLFFLFLVRISFRGRVNPSIQCGRKD
jgi:hypothetical protein